MRSSKFKISNGKEYIPELSAISPFEIYTAAHAQEIMDSVGISSDYILDILLVEQENIPNVSSVREIVQWYCSEYLPRFKS